MRQAADPRSGDLTAKARIRNAALVLYANRGEDATSMRAVADAADVTVGLVAHHYGTKDGLREAVEEYVVSAFADAIAGAPDEGDVAAARNAAVRRMLTENPAVLGYVRRAGLDPAGHRGRVLEMLTELAAAQVDSLRAEGLASTERARAAQVIGVMVRELGQMFLQPMIDQMWIQLNGANGLAEGKPELVVRVTQPGGPVSSN